MVIDTDKVVTSIYKALSSWSFEDINLGDVGVGLIIVGAIAAAFQIHRDWVKRKGFRMVLKDRNDKKHAIWLEIIQDGVDDRVEKQEISRKEGDEMIAEAAKKMKLYDLLPKKRIARMVKETLKRDRALREQARKKGEYQERVPIPGGPPTPIVKPKFTERLGKTAAKFRVKPAA